MSYCDESRQADANAYNTMLSVNDEVNVTVFTPSSDRHPRTILVVPAGCDIPHVPEQLELFD